jgi:hypothetical protein
MIKLKPHITGIAPEILVKFDGVRGPFYVAGARPLPAASISAQSSAPQGVNDEDESQGAACGQYLGEILGTQREELPEHHYSQAGCNSSYHCWPTPPDKVTRPHDAIQKIAIEYDQEKDRPDAHG